MLMVSRMNLFTYEIGTPGGCKPCGGLNYRFRESPPPSLGSRPAFCLCLIVLNYVLALGITSPMTIVSL